jgi:CubicO group peptidase (beta-lactamase class C family)
MKLGIALVAAALLSVTASQHARAETASRTLMCELRDAFTDRVVDTNSGKLDQPEVLLLLGDNGVMGTVRDVEQVSSGDHKLELALVYRGDNGSGRSHAETTYIAGSAPLNTTLVETSIDLGPAERHYILRCYLN